ncbi:MAG: tetratricopeptide repeat protein [Acidobacteria bacterium]|nr:tetratricopeptide repeat protein [Acidobacteriota bacterium]
MPQHLSQDEIQNYAKRSLPPAELLGADEHLRSCDRCFSMLGGVLRSTDIDQAFFDPEDEGHLSYEQIEAFVDGAIADADREIVELHREVCSACEQQLEELVQIRATLQLENATDNDSIVSRPEPSFWTNISAMPLFRFGIPAFAAIVIGAIAWSFWLFDRPSGGVKAVVDPIANNGFENTNTNSGLANTETAAISGANSASTAPMVSLADGPGMIEIDTDGKLKGLNAPQFESRIKAALINQNIEISTAARELRSKSGVLMSDTQPGVSFALTSPVGKVIESARPQFRWRALDQAESYVVSVYDANFNKVAESPPLKQNSWTSITLKRGNVYQWQVTAQRDGEEIRSPSRPAPDARFRVIDSVAANEIDAAKRNFGSSRLLLGILYANAGLLDDAEREFQALLRRNPNSEAARRLLNKVRSAK